MDFSFTEDQLMIAETTESFLNSVASSDAVRNAMATERGFEDSLWKKITEEMGWQLTHIPESFGGLDLGYVELAILFEKMGEKLLCAPFYSSVAFGVNALLCAGTDEQKSDFLTRIASEGLRVSLAYSPSSISASSSAGRNGDLNSITATFEQDGAGYTISGDYAYVIDGHTADYLIVAAREKSGKSNGGLGLFLVPSSAEGVLRKYTPTMDQTRKLASVSLSEVKVSAESALLDCGAAEAHLENILALASIALAAEQMGVANQALRLTVDYIQERSQFGRPVGSFQAMKHKAADMMTKAEAARSAVYYASCIADEFFQGNESGEELLEAASIAKSYCCDAAYFNTGMAIQMHGGVGFTWEYDIHLYFKRAKAAQVSLGDSAWHKERIAEQLLGAAQ